MERNYAQQQFINAGSQESRASSSAGETQYPLITCIMPTANRAAYVARSVQYFLNQDYPNKELVIVYNRDTDLPTGWHLLQQALLPPNIRLVEVRSKIIGAKRNEACRQAQGTIIAFWDDDDLNNTTRLSMQVRPILSGDADIVGLNSFMYYEATLDQAYFRGPEQDGDIAIGQRSPSHMMFTRNLWDSYAQFAEACLWPDRFLWKSFDLFPQPHKAKEVGTVPTSFITF